MSIWLLNRWDLLAVLNEVITIQGDSFFALFVEIIQICVMFGILTLMNMSNKQRYRNMVNISNHFGGKLSVIP